MPPKRTSRPADKQSTLFQARRPTHKSRAAASATPARSAAKRNSQASHTALTPTATPPTSSPPVPVDLVDLRSSSPAVVKADDGGDDDDDDDDDDGALQSQSQPLPSSTPNSPLPTPSKSAPAPAPASARALPVHRPAPPRKLASLSEYSSEQLASVKHLPELNLNDPAFDQYWDYVQRRLRYKQVKPVHAENEDRVQIMLRAFDLDPTYGPSIGMSRLDRWKRAEELGMDPPDGVRLMLDTKQGRLGLNRSVLAEYSVC